jgi:hypothetical protein
MKFKYYDNADGWENKKLVFECVAKTIEEADNTIKEILKKNKFIGCQCFKEKENGSNNIGSGV